MTRLLLSIAWFSALAEAALTLAAAPTWEQIEPQLRATCYECHAGAEPEGGVDLAARTAAPEIGRHFELWQRVLEVVERGDMPPPTSTPLPPAASREIVAFLTSALDAEAAKNAGDPGIVTMRRLTNGEYDRTLLALTGQDYGLASGFDADGGGGEGFSNVGDLLFVSPASLDKYFTAARHVADHATVMPGTGIVFHEHRVGLRGFEQVKAHAEQALYVWYQQKAAPHLPGDFDDLRQTDYLQACWKHRHIQTPLEALAQADGLNLAFLQNWWRLVTSTDPPSRFLDLVRGGWQALPGPDPGAPHAVPPAVHTAIDALAADLRSWNNPKKPGSGVQRRQQDADGIRPYPMDLRVQGHDRVHLCFGDLGDGNAGDVALVTKIDLKLAEGSTDYFTWLERRIGELRAMVPQTADGSPSAAAAAEQAGRLAELEAVHALFGRHPQPDRTVEPRILAVAAPRVVTLPLPPDAVSIKADARLDLEQPHAAEATIQWYATVEAPRDVTRIIPGVLTIWKVQTEAARRTMRDFQVMRTAFPDMFERRLEEVARNLYRTTPGWTVYAYSDEQLGELLGPEDRAVLAAMKTDWRLSSPRQLNAKQETEFDAAMLGHLLQFASHAWRRPLQEAEQEDLAVLYRDGRARGLDRESAIREGLVRVLVSPHFIFKAETLPAAPETTAASSADLPLSDWELASRLSYFLWSSLPDPPLRSAAQAGRLRQPEVLATEARRMLADDRVSALAEDFAGQWLQFAAFDRHEGVDREHYPEMTPAIRLAMKQEAVAFFSTLFREDRRVADIITGRTTFLNEPLAAFYGIAGVTGAAFREVDVSDSRRGGILGMGAMLTTTSRPDRTSPVLRGNYLFTIILGNRSPPPPPNVPELAPGLKPASLREALLRHREDAACSVCHDRIDPLGFALESFDPVGRWRATAEDGSPIDDLGELRDGTPLTGIAGLREYLARNELEFTRTFSRKLLGYALGRSLLPTDRELIDTMVDAIRAADGSVSAAVVAVVSSRQFRHRRHESATTIDNP